MNAIDNFRDGFSLCELQCWDCSHLALGALKDLMDEMLMITDRTVQEAPESGLKTTSARMAWRVQPNKQFCKKVLFADMEVCIVGNVLSILSQFLVY